MHNTSKKNLFIKKISIILFTPEIQKKVIQQSKNTSQNTINH
jgi:hypothetical protein